MRYTFEGFELDTSQATLVGPDGEVPLERQVFDVLALLVQRAGALVTKEELLDEVWGDRFVSESTLTTRVSSARRAVGDDGRAQRVLRTVHGRGYRFLPEVTVAAGDGTAAPRLRVDVSAVRATDDGSATGAPPVDLRPELPAGLRSVARSPFVGRRDALEDATAAFRDGRHPGAGVLWLLGAPGIGKTRLAAEIADRRLLAGPVLFGRCSDDLDVPFQPCIELLRDWLGSDHHDPADPGWATLLRDHGTALQLLVPELVLPDDALVPPRALDEASARYRLVRAWAEWLGHVSRRRPAVLVVDDLHWADPGTLQMLGHTLVSPVEMDAVIVATARDTAPDERDDVAELRARSTTGPYAHVVQLRGLDDDEVAELLGGDERAGMIRSRTAGNPLLARALAGGPGDVEDAAPTLDVAVGRRLSGLPADARTVLTTAAVEGLEFDVPTVARALDRVELDVLDDLELAVGARLVDEVEPDRFRFEHALLRDALRQGMSRSRRRRVHLALADAVEATAPHTEAASRALHHLRASGAAVAPDRLGRLTLSAAERAASVLALDTAASLLREALEELRGTDHAVVTALLLQLAHVEGRAGRHAEAAAIHDEAFLLAERTGDRDTMLEAALGVEDSSWRPGLSGELALRRLAAVEDLVAVDDRHTRTRLAIARARASMYSGRHDDADRAFAEAARLVDELGDERLEAQLLTARNLRGGSVVLPDLLDDATRVVVLGERLGDPEITLMGLQVRATESLRAGDLADAATCVGELERLTSGQHWRFWDYNVAAHRTGLSLYRGELDRAERAIAEQGRIGTELLGEEHAGVEAMQTFVLKRERDELRRLAPLVRRFAAGAGAGAVWTPGLAALLAEVGDLEAAGVVAGRFDPREADPHDATWPAVVALSTEVALRLGDGERARHLVDLLDSQRGRLLVIGHGHVVLGVTERWLGMAHATTGDLDAAEAAYAVAEAMDAHCGSPLAAARSAVLRASVSEARGDHDTAVAHARRALSVAEEHALPALEREAAAVVASLAG